MTTSGERELRDPSQEALAADCEEERRDAERDDPEVRDGIVRGLSLDAHEVDDRDGERGDERGEHRSDPEREPERLGAETARDVVGARPCRSRDLRGRAVLEEVEGREHGQHGCRRGQRRELLPAEVPDDRGVDEDVERLRSEGAERRHRKPKDLAVVRRAEAHACGQAGCSRRTIRPPLDCAIALMTISSTFTCSGRVSAKRTQSATSSAVIGSSPS